VFCFIVLNHDCSIKTAVYWQIVVNVFFTYENDQYVKIRTYFSKNKIHMIRILEHW